MAKGRRIKGHRAESGAASVDGAEELIVAAGDGDSKLRRVLIEETEKIGESAIYKEQQVIARPAAAFKELEGF